ncbi:hypothetical protein KO494_09760 [Lacinutrix sp. C3R15]|uniref:hypothetical protein n=1 Tax=Flavobacteriaceae TaxID=49546 RepID=UPI001C0828CF|nr:MULTISPECIES: hypothetical protein [Flavobacteriaceae]MBU2939824.1 hypothetical protein [Lacinutrix sp. C3R15]MDO6623140.1 hypothetical protein [Oceanihabitans sp. 1_MG-2023]
MKKAILLFVFSLAVFSSSFAQKAEKKVNAYIEAVESKTTLTSAEKETLITLKTAHINAISEINANYEKGSEELKARRKESNKEFSKSLNKAFGKDRAKEIKAASRKDKSKKKKKKN